MADFNLSAAVSLQLAQGAVKKLIDDANAQFSNLQIVPKVDDKKIEGEMKKTAKKAKKAVTNFDIPFNFTFDRKKFENEFLSKPFKVKIELADGEQDKFRRQLAGLFDITRKGVKLLLAEQNALEAKAKSTSKKIKEAKGEPIADKGQQNLNALKKFGESVDQASKKEEDLKAATLATKKQITDLIDQIDKLALAELNAGKNAGSFYRTLKVVADQIKRVGGVVSDDFVDIFNNVLSDGNGAKILGRNITSIGLAIKQLNLESAKLDRLEKLDKNFDLSGAREEIQSTIDNLVLLINRSELSDSRATNKAITENMKNVRSAVRDVTNEVENSIKSFQSLEDILKGRIVVAQQSTAGKSKSQARVDINNAKEQLKLFKELRKAGSSLDDIKIQLKISDNDISAMDKANAKIEEFRRKAQAFGQSLSIGSFDNTQGFKSLEVAKQAAKITKDTIKSLEDARDAGANADDLGLISNTGKERLNQLRKDAGELNRILTDLDKSRVQFDLDGLSSASEKTQNLITDLQNGKIALNDFNNVRKIVSDRKAQIQTFAIDEKQSKKLPELLGSISSLADAQTKLNKALNNGQGNTFFEFAAKKISELDQNAKKLNLSLGYLFAGANANPAENLARALNILYKETARLQTLRGNASNILDDTTRNKILANINAVEQKINNLFLSFDISNSGAFSSQIRSLTQPINTELSTALRNATRNVEDLEQTIARLNAQKLKIVALNPSNAREQVDTLNALLKLLDQFKQSGKSANDFIQDKDVIDLQILLESLQKSGQVVDTVYNKFQKLKQLLSSKFANQNIPQALGIDQRAQAIIDKYNASISAIAGNANLSPRDRSGLLQINEASSKDEISTLTLDTQALINQIERLNDEELKLNTAGLSSSAKAVADLRQQILSLLSPIAEIPEITKAVNDGLIKIGQTQDSEKKLLRYLSTIDRLRATLVSLDGEDLSNVTGKLDDLENKIKGLSASGADDRSIKDALSKGTFDVRQAQKFNNVVADTTDKLALLADQQKVPKSAEAFRQASVEFNKFAQNIASSSAPALEKLRQIENKTKAIIFLAKIKADGGFFDSFAKAAGLAAKRLGAFLGLAQGLYGIQSVIVDSIRTAVQLDKEFIKLQQVFSTDLSGNALAKQVEETSVQILSLAKNYGVATDQVAEGAKIFAQAGIAGKDLAKILEIVAKTELGPSFENVGETAEATIALMNQFSISANNVEEALGGVSRVSAKYPVEAGGITAAIRRAGSTFDATGDSLANFVSAFTVVKTATREADETIATALRNIASRIQRSQTQEYLKEAFGINLLNDQGLFVGFNESIKLVGKKIQELGINSADPRFSELLDKLAGQRQAGKLKPLIENFSDLEKIVKDFAKGSDSINQDVGAALEGIENKLLRAKAAVVELFTELARSTIVKGLVDAFTNLTQILTTVVRGFNGVTGAALLAFGVMKAMPSLKSAAQFGLAEILPHVFQRGIKRNKGGKADTSGYIPGGGPNVDSVLAYLTRGEFVLRRSAVKKYGLDFLNNLNEGKISHANTGGQIKGFNSGGLIPGFMVGGLNDKSSGLSNLQQLAAKAGVVISKKLLETMIDTFKILPLDVPFGGVFKPKKKELGYRPDQSLKTIVHELGHGLDKILPKNFEDKFSPEYIGKTQKAIDKRPDLYGEKGTEKYNKNLKSEVRANILKDINEFKKTGVAPSSNQSDLNLLKEAEDRYNQAGVRFRDPNEIQKKKEAGVKATADKREKIINDTLYDKNTPKQLKKARAGKSIGLQDFGIVNSNLKTTAIGLKTFNNSANQASTGLKGLKGPIQIALLGLTLFGDKLLGTSESLQALTTIFIGAATKLALINAVKSYAGLDTVGKIRKQGAAGGAGLQFANNKQKFKEEYLSKTSGFLNSGVDKKKVALEIAARKKAEHYAKPENLQRAQSRFLGTGSYAGGKPPKESTITKIISAPFKKLGQNPQVAGLLQSKGGKIASQAARGLGSTVKSAVVTSKGNVLALAAFAAGEALGYFASKAEESADEAFEASRNESDALEALTKKRRAQSVQGAIKKGGAIAGATATGALFGGVPGAIVGAIVGSIYAFLPEITKSIKSVFGVDIPSIFKSIGDTISSYYSVAAEYVGWFVDGVGDFLAYLTGNLEERKKGQAEDIISARKIGGLKRAAREAKKGVGALYNQDNAAIIGATVKTGNQKIAKAGSFDTLPQEEKERLKLEAENLKAALNAEGVTAKNRIAYIAEQKAAGVDILKFFKDTGVSFDHATDQMEVATSKIGLFFAKFQDTLDKSSARLSGIEGGIDFISNKDSQAFVPDQIFDIIKQGFNPKDLGFGDISNTLDPLLNQVKKFDPNLSEGLNFTIKGLETTRQIRSGLANSKDLKLETGGATPQETLDAFLEDTFKNINKNNGGPEELNNLFNEFLTQNQEEVAKAIDQEGNVDISRTNDLMKNFADDLDKGFVDTIQRMNDANKKFGEAYRGLLDQRMEIEKAALQYDLANIDVSKEQDSFVNQARNLSGDKLLAAQKQQAEANTDVTLGLKLKGTGLGAGATTGQLGQALQNSQKRLDDAARIAYDELKAKAGKNPVSADDLTKKTSEIQSQESGNIEKFSSALQYLADGTDEFKYSMEAFSKAAEKAAKSSEFLTNNLLGTDDQLMQTVRGLQLEGKLQTLKPEDRMSYISTLNQADRQALQSSVSQRGDDEMKKFQESIGISSNILASNEAQKVMAGFQERGDANVQQAQAEEAKLPALNKQIEDLKAFYQMQMDGTNQTINMFNQAVNKVAETIAQVPTVINHTMKVDGVVNIVGGDFLAKSTEALKAAIDAEIAKQLQMYDAKLRESNSGLNTGVAAAITNAPPIADVMF